MLRSSLAPSWDGRRPEWISAAVLLVVLLAAPFAAALLQAAGLPLFWPVYVLSFLALPLLMHRLWARPLVLVTALFAWFAVNKFAVALVAGAVDATIAAWLQNYKELMYLVLFGVGVWYAARHLPPARRTIGGVVRGLMLADLLALAFCALVLVYFGLGLLLIPSDLGGELVYARRFASLPIIFLAGRLLVVDWKQFDGAIRYLVGIAFLVALFGLVEWTVLGDRFWRDVIHVDVLRGSLVEEGLASDRSRLVNGIPANWISFLQGITIRRLVSTFLEPTTLALFLALAVSLGAHAVPAWRGRHRRIWIPMMIVMVAALLATMGKAGIMVAVLTSIVVLARTTRRTGVRVAALMALVAAAGLAIGLLLPFGNNLLRHLSGLSSGLGQVLRFPFGTGLGTTGFWGDRVSVGTDSTTGAIASQVGLLGVVLYVGWLLAIAWQILPTDATSAAERPIRRVMAGAILALLVAGIVSNSASGLLGGAWYALLAGWLIAHLGSRRAELETTDP